MTESAEFRYFDTKKVEKNHRKQTDTFDLFLIL